VGFVAYDAASGLEPKFEVRRGYKGPLVWFMGCDRVDGRPIPEGIATQPARSGAHDTWIPEFEPDEYRRKVSAIIDGIGRGDFYQVNLTERFSARIQDPFRVYERIRVAQQAPYSAFIQTAEMAVLTVSPELFLHRDGAIIESRPMKGTSRRGRWSEEDDELARRLSESEKERAENVMIVDLIRNDMGRIAVPGSVEVPSMFTVEKYPTVLQMTSHVKSQLKERVSLTEIFAALFPCGSVTGAPKIAASKSIATLENTPRGVYCGAVGVLRPGGDVFTFNVAIRTAVVINDNGTATYGAGGGITADSDPDRELAEMEAKAAVLTSMPREVELLETLRLENGLPVRLNDHLERLRQSSEYFSFLAFDISGIRDTVEAVAREYASGIHRLRVIVQRDGRFSVTAQPFAKDVEPRTLGLSRTPVDSVSPYLYHKLADRTLYAERRGEVTGVDDVVLVNERGELTETTIGNVVLDLGGKPQTPALACGLLPGIYRSHLLGSGAIEEAVLYPSDLIRAKRIWTVNSLREWVPCRLADPTP
jgi:para-aminobenzoate synthetase/4-amino-4-deoxychorismate lyase